MINRWERLVGRMLKELRVDDHYDYDWQKIGAGLVNNTQKKKIRLL